MINQSQNSAQERVLADLKFLSGQGTIGFYSRCEITEIFFTVDGVKVPVNLFTLVVFEDAALPDSDREKPNPKYLNKKRIPIKSNKNYQCGIVRYYLSVPEFADRFKKFIESGEWRISHERKLLRTSQLTFLPKQYVPTTKFMEEVAVNSVLKNNFHSGSYILEGFAENKANVDIFYQNPVALKQLSQSIYDILPISLAKLSDRLGNIILQFPIEILAFDLSFLKGDTPGVHLDIFWNPKVAQTPSCEIIIKNELDGVLLGFDKKEIVGSSINLTCTNISKVFELILFDQSNQVILHQMHTVPLKTINIGMGHIPPEKRTLTTQSKQENIQLFSQDEKAVVGETPTQNYITWTQKRLYEEELAEQKRSLSFVQYGGENGNQREKALNDVRTLINHYGQLGVCLWDPYLTAKDIKETLYFCQYHDAPMRAIGSKKAFHSENFDNSKNENREELKTSQENNNLGISLEFRVQQDQKGWKFHDRFLIFPDVNERVKAWSLGTSVNSLGNEHHILQEIKNSRQILDAFNELWEKLEDESCLVWRHPDV